MSNPNDHHIARIKSALYEAYGLNDTTPGDDVLAIVANVLTDLMLYTDYMGLPFEEALYDARRDYTEEIWP